MDKTSHSDSTGSDEPPLWPPLLIGITVLYIVSMYPWWAYLVTSTFDAVIFGAKLDTPEAVTYLWGLVLYPPILFFALLLAFLSCIAHRFRLAVFFVLLPAIEIGIMLLIVIVLIPLNYRLQIEQSPPNSLMRLLAEQDAISTPILPSGEIYLPQSVTYNDLVKWTDEGVIFQTSIPRDEVFSFYNDIYGKLGYRVTAFNSRNQVYHKASNAKLCVTIFSEEEGQQIVTVYRGQDFSICFGLESGF